MPEVDCRVDVQIGGLYSSTYSLFALIPEQEVLQR